VQSKSGDSILCPALRLLQINEEDRPPQVLYRCGEEYFMHQVTSTTSPHNQIPLIGTSPELPPHLTEGSLDGSQSFSSETSLNIQVTSPKHVVSIPKDPSSPPPVIQQQVIVSFLFKKKMFAFASLLYNNLWGGEMLFEI
jgi:hypothetical protein